MKKIFAAALLTLTIFGCADNKQQEKEVYNKVIELHDKVMADKDALIKNKMQLDTLLAQPTLAVKDHDVALNLSKTATAADSAMDDWMHHFEPDYSAKPHDEAMKYLNDQHAQIVKIDSLTKTAVEASNKFLLTHKK
ncbi:hypothetical protein GCM10023149_40620 [Mucilaginibacter gynuensis]|uniref:Uncharacterized protein n=1 Tax=Mucilaginibacter gynuensis TaxID=1302236 RepID=A0ABP8H352_9SPHI